MNKLLPTIALVAGLTGCSGKNESPDIQQKVLAATSACLSIKQELIALNQEDITQALTNAKEVIIERTSPDIVNTITSLGMAQRDGEHNYSPIEISAPQKVASILASSGIAGCIYNKLSGNQGVPLFFDKRVPSSSEILANSLNGMPLKHITRFPESSL